MPLPPDKTRQPRTSEPNPLESYKQALRPHFPSKEALLQEGEAHGQRARTRKGVAALCTGLVVAALWLANPAVETVRLATAVGEQQAWSLRDGTRIQLNTNSVAVLENRLRGRRLRLEQGETMVTVAHGWRSFAVVAGDSDILDIGTVFNVRRNRDDVDVAVIRGAVEVRPNPQDAAIRLSGGQALAIRQSRAGQPVALRVGAVAWANGKLVLDGTPLRDVVADMQRYRSAPIRLRDARAADLRLSGEYNITGIESLLDALPAVLPVRVARHADNSIDIAWRQKNL